jgi:3-hydroxybutyryl-CoA dehydratase
VGDSAELSRIIAEEDVMSFADLTGDWNPVHVDEEAAKQSRFGQRIAHGILVAGHVSAALGTKLPGPGAIYLGQTLRFEKPVYIGDTVTTRVEVTGTIPEKRRVRITTSCSNQRGEIVLTGEALLLMP